MSAMKIRKLAIDELQKKYGRVRADDLVKEARSRNHPLHDDFEWDDKTAAQMQRIDRARELISSVRIMVRVNRVLVPSVGYVRDPRCASDEQGYVSIVDLQTESDIAYEALIAETSRIKAALERTKEIAAVLGLESELNDLLNGILHLQTRARRGRTQPPDDIRPSV